MTTATPRTTEAEEMVAAPGAVRTYLAGQDAMADASLSPAQAARGGGPQ